MINTLRHRQEMISATDCRQDAGMSKVGWKELDATMGVP
jgi:hypothetical protein